MIFVKKNMFTLIDYLIEMAINILKEVLLVVH